MATKVQEASDSKTTSIADLNNVIADALSKVAAARESELCYYLPGERGRHMHHLSFRRLKSKDPKQLAKLINDNVMQPSMPNRLPPRERKPKSSRKQGFLVSLERSDVEQLLAMIGQSQSDVVLRVRNSLYTAKDLKRKLMDSLRRDEVDDELWATYRELRRANSKTEG